MGELLCIFTLTCVYLIRWCIGFRCDFNVCCSASTPATIVTKWVIRDIVVELEGVSGSQWDLCVREREGETKLCSVCKCMTGV